MKILRVNQPEDYFTLFEDDFSSQLVQLPERPDMVHLFVKSAAELDKHINKLLKVIKPTTLIWISWHKKSSGIPTDLSENVIRDIILKTVLGDVKVCAVSDKWSSLKVVGRVKYRNFT